MVGVVVSVDDEYYDVKFPDGQQATFAENELRKKFLESGSAVKALRESKYGKSADTRSKK